MRATTPIGGAWPADMVLTVDDSPHHLLELLWVRQAHALEPRGADLPPLLEQTPPRADAVLDEPTRTAWSGAWPFVWDAVQQHAAALTDADDLERLRSFEPASEERSRRFRAMVGPSWRDRFGDAAFDSAHSAWTEARFAVRSAQPVERLEGTPERRSLDALVQGGRRGSPRSWSCPAEAPSPASSPRGRCWSPR